MLISLVVYNFATFYHRNLFIYKPQYQLSVFTLKLPPDSAEHAETSE